MIGRSMMITRRFLPTVVAIALAIAVFVSQPCGASIRDEEGRGGPTPPRLSFTDGEVSFWRPGAEDWSQAQINTAIAAGDAVYAGDGANLEIQIGSRAFIRAGADTQIELS